MRKSSELNMKSGSEHSKHTPKSTARPWGENLLVRSEPRRERGLECQRIVSKIEPSSRWGWDNGQAGSSGESGQKTEFIPGALGSPDVTKVFPGYWWTEHHEGTDVAVTQGRDGGNLNWGDTISDGETQAYSRSVGNICWKQNVYIAWG